MTTVKYRQGQLLITSKTKGWTDEQRAKADYEERKAVFANFNNEDEGKSRKLICICPTPEEAELVVKALSEHSTKEPVAWLCEKEGCISRVVSEEEIILHYYKEQGYKITELVKK